MTLFADEQAAPVGHAPLADRMRPATLAELLGQDALLGPGRLLTQALAAERLPSMILWGPPGCGKTTVARLVAKQSRLPFAALSAVFAGVKEVRAVVERAKSLLATGAGGSILFMDEIHRFNKAQQDAFLPYVENGTIILLGATTENPSFELNGALLSRCRVVVLNPLTEADLVVLLRRAVEDTERGLGRLGLNLEESLLQRIANEAEGDGRYALNLLETLVTVSGVEHNPRPLTLADLAACLHRRAALYDKAGEGHFNLISALHKSLRGSDADAALYWLARMLAGGEDGLYIARRLIRFASEDIGNADPQALGMALHAREAYHFLGSPEGELALAQAVVYLATAPKSNSLYTAYQAAQAVAKTTGHLLPPLHIRNAPTRLLKELGYGANYRYPHDHELGYVAAEYLPESLHGHRFYQPVARGFEREIAKRLAYWQRLKERANKKE
ncbi:MAG: replication-associated recombination protein A [Magnetococcales bacterium]|nr:replication-associated recombination protein A [Magnetococcales bacterium]